MNVTPFLIGLTASLSLWIINVSSMEQVLVRNNDKNEPTLSLNNLILYAKLPFTKTDIAWPTEPNLDIHDRIKLLSLNWIVMASLGLTGGYIYQSFF